LLKCAISSAEQHIVQAPQDFPGAAVIKFPTLPPRLANRSRLNVFLPLFQREKEADRRA
jgi:hypothetical protein